jgi:hypothetical protein
MGLDAVEIVLRVEELFDINIKDGEAAEVRTVGDFDKLICVKLNLTALPSPITPAELPVITQKDKQFWFVHKHTPLPAPPEVLPWSSRSVWDCMVATFVDQMALKAEEITYYARIATTLASVGLDAVTSMDRAISDATG